jgi:hypothetical protein
MFSLILSAGRRCVSIRHFFGRQRVVVSIFDFFVSVRRLGVTGLFLRLFGFPKAGKMNLAI